jgi:hypothetical protein
LLVFSQTQKKLAGTAFIKKKLAKMAGDNNVISMNAKQFDPNSKH